MTLTLRTRHFVGIAVLVAVVFLLFWRVPLPDLTHDVLAIKNTGAIGCIVSSYIKNGIGSDDVIEILKKNEFEVNRGKITHAMNDSINKNGVIIQKNDKLETLYATLNPDKLRWLYATPYPNKLDELYAVLRSIYSNSNSKIGFIEAMFYVFLGHSREIRIYVFLVNDRVEFASGDSFDFSI